MPPGRIARLTPKDAKSTFPNLPPNPHPIPAMDNPNLKAAVFDAEQALTWARQAIDEGDVAATREALAQAAKNIAAAEAALDQDES